MILQSGNNFTPNKLNVECDDNLLGTEVVYMNICAKYSDMQSMAGRTLLFNPTEVQKQAYNIAFEAMNHLVSSLKPGSLISDSYNSTIKFIKSKNSELVEKLHSNLGFGIGMKFKEDELLITATNSTKIEPGMVFHVRLSFKDVEKPASKGPILIADTVLVMKDEDNQVLTG